jgi:hypothetical protein
VSFLFLEIDARGQRQHGGAVACGSEQRSPERLARAGASRGDDERRDTRQRAPTSVLVLVARCRRRRLLIETKHACAHLVAALDELDGHELARLLVARELHEAKGAAVEVPDLWFVFLVVFQERRGRVSEGRRSETLSLSFREGGSILTFS